MSHKNVHVTFDISGEPALSQIARAEAEIVCILDRTTKHGSRCECGKWRKAKCGFPNQGSVCGAPLCNDHGHEIRPGLTYCTPHYERAMEAKARARK